MCTVLLSSRPPPTIGRRARDADSHYDIIQELGFQTRAVGATYRSSRTRPWSSKHYRREVANRDVLETRVSNASQIRLPCFHVPSSQAPGPTFVPTTHADAAIDIYSHAEPALHWFARHLSRTMNDSSSVSAVLLRAYTSQEGSLPTVQ